MQSQGEVSLSMQGIRIHFQPNLSLAGTALQVTVGIKVVS